MHPCSSKLLNQCAKLWIFLWQAKFVVHWVLRYVLWLGSMWYPGCIVNPRIRYCISDQVVIDATSVSRIHSVLCFRTKVYTLSVTLINQCKDCNKCKSLVIRLKTLHKIREFLTCLWNSNCEIFQTFIDYSLSMLCIRARRWFNSIVWDILKTFSNTTGFEGNCI